METFAAYGYDGASVKAIARSAGVSEALIYGHFPSKQALHAGALEAQRAELMAWVQGRVREAWSAGAPHGAGLRAGIDAILEFAEERPYAWRLLFRDPPADGELMRLHRRVQVEWTDAIAELLVAGCDYRLPGDTAPEQGIAMVAALIKAGLEGVAARWQEHPEIPREEVVDLFVAVVFTGLERLSTPAEGRLQS